MQGKNWICTCVLYKVGSGARAGGAWHNNNNPLSGKQRRKPFTYNAAGVGEGGAAQQYNGAHQQKRNENWKIHSRSPGLALSIIANVQQMQKK